MMMETYFQVASAHLAMSAREKTLRRPSEAQTLLGKRSTLFSSRVMKSLYVGSSKRPPAGA